MSEQSFSEDFKRRIKEIKTTRWIRFGIVSVIFLLWLCSKFFFSTYISPVTFRSHGGKKANPELYGQ